ncbi:MAG: redoxin family protein [Planctomycetes bacterium]|nr:redoxin family protein [Planctomycetota bacterium]
MKKTSLLFFLLPIVALGSCKFLVKQIVDYTDYWPSGLPKTRGTLAGDKQDGEWTLFFESGRPMAKGAYQADRQFGPWTFYYENGGEKRSGAYDDNGLRTGEWLYKYEDATPQARGSYVGDFEDGLWTFYGEDGRVSMEGQYDAGKQSGWWTFHYPGGAPKAQGIYFRGDRVGPWQVWSEAGATRIQDFGQKAGVQLVRQVWSGTDQERRVGALQNGKPVGRWTSFHANGRVRFCCGMDAGVPNGVFEARDENGGVIAQGRFEGGRLVAGGTAVAAGVTRELVAGDLPAMPAGVDPWADQAALASASPEQQVAVFVHEQQLDVGAQPFVAVEVDGSAQPAGAPAPVAAAIVEEIDEQPGRMPAAPQPQLTVKQKRDMEKYIDEYTNGPKPGGGMFSGGDYAPPAGSPRPKGGVGRREQLEGKPLPFDVMTAVDGEDVDLRSYHGKQRVMIVVLRGFLGEVCCYCVAQTKALAKARAKLEANNVEVLVIYPGPLENEESFRQIYEEEFGEGPPPYRVFYDQDLELVTKLGIEGDLASPSTFLIDEQGIVRYAYVGEHRADRPATNKLIKLIEGMK